MKKAIKETIHAKGIDINIYTTDFENEYVSLTDIARIQALYHQRLQTFEI